MTTPRNFRQGIGVVILALIVLSEPAMADLKAKEEAWWFCAPTDTRRLASFVDYFPDADRRTAEERQLMNFGYAMILHARRWTVRNETFKVPPCGNEERRFVEPSPDISIEGAPSEEDAVRLLGRFSSPLPALYRENPEGALALLRRIREAGRLPQ